MPPRRSKRNAGSPARAPGVRKRSCPTHFSDFVTSDTQSPAVPSNTTGPSLPAATSVPRRPPATVTRRDLHATASAPVRPPASLPNSDVSPAGLSRTYADAVQSPPIQLPLPSTVRDAPPAVPGSAPSDQSGSMNSYMEGGMNTLHQTFQQPVYQTGNQFQNGGVSGLGGAAMGLSSAPSANSGMGDTSYNSWMSHFGLSGSGNEPMQKQTTGGNAYQHYLEPDFQEFYRPVFGVIPGRCTGVDYRCPTECWRTNTYSGCIECACQAPNTTPPSPTTEREVTTAAFVPSTTPAPTTIEVPLTTPSNTSGEKSNETNGGLTTVEPSSATQKVNDKPTTTSVLQTTAAGNLLNMESLSAMSGADLILMLMDGMRRNQSLQQMLQQMNMQMTQETTTSRTTITTTPTITQGTTSTASTTSTEPTTSTETIHKSLQIDNCPAVDMSCPLKCLIFDSISRCTLCSCMDTLLPKENSSHECQDIDVSCPSHCIAIDDYLCPVCTCLSTTASPAVTSTTSHTEAQTTTEAPNREPVTFSQGTVCPPIPLTCPIKCIEVDVDYCPVCRCSGQDGEDEKAL